MGITNPVSSGISPNVFNKIGGKLIYNTTLGGADSSLAMGANIIHFAPFIAPFDFTINPSIHFQVDAAPVGAKGYIAVYDSDPVTLLPKTRMVITAEILYGAVGVGYYTPNLVVGLTGGNRYWFAFNNDTAGVSIRGSTSYRLTSHDTDMSDPAPGSMCAGNPRPYGAVGGPLPVDWIYGIGALDYQYYPLIGMQMA